MAQTSSVSRQQGFGSALVKTWLAVALTDALFASATGMFIAPYATPARVFRGVASVLFGKEMLTPNLNLKYSIQFIGHPIFVVGPMILVNRRGAAGRA